MLLQGEMQELKFIHSTSNPDAPVAYCSFTAMHTVIECLFVDRDRRHADMTSKRILELVEGLERSLSRHFVNGSLYQFNESTDFTSVDEDLYMSLELCEQMRAATEGFFDIAALCPSRERPAYHTLPRTHSAKRVSNDIFLDLGGFAKGYAAEKVRTMMTGEGIVSALLNFGNSTVAGIGHHPLGEYWIVTPAEGDNHDFHLRDSALSISGRTSGGMEHIVDPHTMRFSGKDGMIAVTGRSALVCEILSTGLYAAPEDRHEYIMRQFPNYTTHRL